MEIKLVSVNGEALPTRDELMMGAYNSGGKDMLDAISLGVAALPADSTLAEVVAFIEGAKVDPQ